MAIFNTHRKESKRTTLMRWAFNFWPCIWCTGSRVTFIADDFRELHVQLKLNIRTRNRVGTVFGGSIYSSIDPYFMLLLMEVLGKNFVVWDKAASIKFVRPITDSVKCKFEITDETVEEIKRQVDDRGEYTFELPLVYVDENDKVFAAFNKTIYVADKSFYRNKSANRIV